MSVGPEVFSVQTSANLRYGLSESSSDISLPNEEMGGENPYPKATGNETMPVDMSIINNRLENFEHRFENIQHQLAAIIGILHKLVPTGGPKRT